MSGPFAEAGRLEGALMWVQSGASAGRPGRVRAPCDLIPGAPSVSTSLEGPCGPNGPWRSLCHTVNTQPLTQQIQV